jgi:hypothetical protein
VEKFFLDHLAGSVFVFLYIMLSSEHLNQSVNFNRLLLGKPEGRRPLGRPRRRWLYNIRMGIVEVGWSDEDWIGLAQDWDRWRALVTSLLNLRLP